ncbi:MAG TPA: DUF86 domain-containing protein [Deltaproteobacteria bacterium]|nr:DUF86 domain-containing protein [Deltaproteobacteria bacterium]
MVISNLNTKLIEDRLGFITKALSRLRNLSRLEEKVFVENDRPAIAESYLRRALEAIFDIGRHIIAKSADKGLVEYKEIAAALGKNGVLTEKLAEKLKLMAGYRNRLVHFYHDVSDQELYSILKNHLADIEAFVLEIAEFLKAYRKSI